MDPLDLARAAREYIRKFDPSTSDKEIFAIASGWSNEGWQAVARQAGQHCTGLDVGPTLEQMRASL